MWIKATQKIYMSRSQEAYTGCHLHPKWSLQLLCPQHYTINPTPEKRRPEGIYFTLALSAVTGECLGVITIHSLTTRLPHSFYIFKILQLSKASQVSDDREEALSSCLQARLLLGPCFSGGGGAWGARTNSRSPCLLTYLHRSNNSAMTEERALTPRSDQCGSYGQ